MMPSLVSVVIPTHNRSNLLGRAIRSVLQQSWRGLEVIVVDDASSDDTQRVVERFLQEYGRIQYVRLPVARGGAGARNAGIAEARGEWLAFLDDDDYWLPRKLEKQLQLLSNVPNASGASCAFETSTFLGRRRVYSPPPDVSWEQLLVANLLGTASACVCRASVLARIGGFDPSLRGCQDWDLWIRLRHEGPILSVPDVLLFYESHRGPRITRDMVAKYCATRRLYFKYRVVMSEELRRAQIATLLYYRSRRPDLSAASRLRSLLGAVGLAGDAAKWEFVRSSLPRILLSGIKKDSSGTLASDRCRADVRG